MGGSKPARRRLQFCLDEPFLLEDWQSVGLDLLLLAAESIEKVAESPCIGSWKEVLSCQILVSKKTVETKRLIKAVLCAMVVELPVDLRACLA